MMTHSCIATCYVYRMDCKLFHSKLSILEHDCFTNHVKTLNHKQWTQTLSETQYDWWKIEPVTMKANFIHFWCVESESIVKNKFHNWTSELRCIWHIFEKLGYFWLFLSAPVQATSGCCQCWSAREESKMCQMHPNSANSSIILVEFRTMLLIVQVKHFKKYKSWDPQSPALYK